MPVTRRLRGLPIAFAILLVACGGNNVAVDAQAQPDVAYGTGQFGADCSEHTDCAGRYCVEAVGGIGGVCTNECGDCPAEWTCREVTFGDTAVRVCVPDAPQLCLACADDAECGTGAACILNDGERSCATKCTSGCPVGYMCLADPSGMHSGMYCQPATGSCTCTAGIDGASRACTSSNTVGTCFGTQTCDPAVGWSTCSAAAAILENCDGDDNDCDFLIDEDTGGGEACSNTVTGIGTCPGARQCGGSIGYVCEGQIPSAEICNYADEDCDGTVDETFSGIGTLCSPGIGGCKRFGSIRCVPDGSATECSVIAGTPEAELCNQVDDDCNGAVDEVFPTLGDSCSTGVGACQRFGTTACDTGGLTTTCSVTAGTPVTELCNQLDDNCNGSVDETFPTVGNGCSAGVGACQRFGATVCASGGTTTTCSVTAGSPSSELCNSIDDNCNGFADETFTTLGDGCSTGIGGCQRFGTRICASGGATTTCSATAGSPVAELCNQIDDNCNGSADETFTTLGNGCSVGVGTCQRFGTTVCASGGATTTCSATPGTAGTEICNQLDDNCNGSTDETFPTLGNACSAGVGVCQRFGTTMCASGGLTTTCSVMAGPAGTESCNELDDNCNGSVDETFPTLGTGCSTGMGACQRFGTTVCASGGATTTCSATAGSPTAELCNSIDDNCNGVADETFTTLGNSCAVGVGACQRFGTTVCASGGATTTCSVAAGSPVAEVCNQIDDNCNGSVDETFTTLGNSCSVGIGTCQRFGTTVCASGGATTTCSATPGTAGTELCNQLDDNCNGSVDETFPTLGSSCSAGLGVCQRFGTTMCAGGGMTTTCSVTAGTNMTSETCNYLDDDCNGTADNGFRNALTGVYDLTAHCGSCGNDCAQVYMGSANATGQCSTSGSPQCVMVCSAGTSDLNTSSFDGCEFVLDNTSVYVSTTDAAAADDATCGLGPTGTGAGNHPCRTITFGLTRATGLSRANVRVADGTYNESVTLISGKNVYGGYRPTTWDRHLATTSTLIQGVSLAGNHDRTIVAINVSNATFEGFVVRGSFNTKTSGNSYAIYISGGASTLVIKDNQIFAGRGGAGLEGSAGGNGATGPDGTGSVNGSYNGFTTNGSPCSSSQSRQFSNGAVFSCGGQNVSGGNGGGNNCPPATNYTQFSAVNGFAGMGGGGGGAGGAASQGGFDGTLQSMGPNTTCFLPASPMTGADGLAGGSGSNASGVAGCSSAAGTVVSGQWTNGNAATGVAGFAGGGGSGGGAGGGGACTQCGGGAKDRLGAHGGGGGAGACGGSGGGAGGAGGGVFGIFIVSGAAPTITNNTIQRGSGGTAGDGGIGGAGGIGGRGGQGGASVTLCSAKAGLGGTGGNGGNGSGGGGGCGGSSYGIFTSGVGTPTYCTTNTVAGGSAGSGGVGGFSGGNPGGNGTAGVLQGCTSI